MYKPSVGFNPGKGLLSGLKGSRKSPAGQMAYGQAMAGAADLNLQKSKQDAQFGMQQLEGEQGLRQAKAQQNARQDVANTQQRTEEAAFENRKDVFDTNMRFSYDQLRKRQQMNLRQALLNQVARSYS